MHEDMRKEVWLRVYCAALQRPNPMQGFTMASASTVADAALREFDQRFGPQPTVSNTVPGT